MFRIFCVDVLGYSLYLVYCRLVSEVFRIFGEDVLGYSLYLAYCRLVSEVFRIFGEDVLGYSLYLVQNTNINHTLEPDIQFANISSCRTKL